MSNSLFSAASPAETSSLLNTLVNRISVLPSEAALQAIQAEIAAIPAPITLHPGYLADRWYGSSAVALAGAAVVADLTRAFPVQIFSAITIDSLGLNITTGNAGANTQLAVYSNVNGRPGVVLGNTGNISVAATGFQSGALGASLALSPGIYWLLSNFDTAVTVAMSVSSATSFNTAMTGAAAGINAIATSLAVTGISTALTFGTWSDLSAATWADILTARTPLIAFHTLA